MGSGSFFGAEKMNLKTHVAASSATRNYLKQLRPSPCLTGFPLTLSRFELIHFSFELIAKRPQRV